MTSSKHDKETTHFGFKTVAAEEKASMVKQVFATVAPRYDLMNDAMSLGVHHLWKNTFMEMLHPEPGTRLLDVAGGTGDVAFKFLKATNGSYYRGSKSAASQTSGAHVPSSTLRSGFHEPADSQHTLAKPLEALQSTYHGSHVTVCDINPHMLEEGRNRAINKNILHGIEWICGDAEKLPVPDMSYDYYTIAFGIRNVTHIDKALEEAYRVLKPGGRFMCLEFSHVPNPLLAKFYDAYSFHVIPKMGKVLAGDAQPYQYLVESIRKFPDQETFKGMIKAAGFSQVTYRNLSMGVVAIHSGWRI